MTRRSRMRSEDPIGVPWSLEGQPDLVAVDTTWGHLQPLHCAPGVVTVGELELIEKVRDGAALVDTRIPESRRGVTIPGAVNIPHDGVTERRDEFHLERLTILFCNGPQCRQTPDAIKQLLRTGYPASALAYYRGGLHDWVSLAMPTAPTE